MGASPAGSTGSRPRPASSKVAWTTTACSRTTASVAGAASTTGATCTVSFGPPSRRASSVTSCARCASPSSRRSYGARATPAEVADRPHASLPVVGGPSTAVELARRPRPAAHATGAADHTDADRRSVPRPGGAGRWWRRLAGRTRRPCPSSPWLRHRRTRCRWPAGWLSASGEPVIQPTPPQSPLSEAQNRHDRPVTRVTASATSLPKAIAPLSFPGQARRLHDTDVRHRRGSGVPCTTWTRESVDGPTKRSSACSMKSMRPVSVAILSLAVSISERCSTRADHMTVPAAGENTVVQAKMSWPVTSRTRPATSAA